MAKLYVQAVPPVDMNKNTEWFMYPGVWTTYILILFFSWLIFLSVFGCNPGTAWTIVNLVHFAITYHFFHWKKGTPFSDDQGIYNSLTWWEQIDNGKQLTRNRKFLTVVPVVLYLIASHTTDYQHPMLFLNTVAVIVLVIAKLPNMHKSLVALADSRAPLVFPPLTLPSIPTTVKSSVGGLDMASPVALPVIPPLSSSVVELISTAVHGKNTSAYINSRS
ncbi:ORM1-like protein, partial [Musa troglodytarum]